MILTSDNYFSKEASLAYMSASQFKAFGKCEYYGYADAHGLFHREQTQALLIGSYVDAYFEGTLPEFRTNHPEIFKRDGTLKSEYLRADDIIQRILSDRMMTKYMSGEKQVIMTCEIEGVPFKCKMDVYHPGKAIVDLKVMRDFNAQYKAGEGRLNFVQYWGYDLQGAIYQECVWQNTGEKLPFIICAATKETVPDIGLFSVEQEILDAQLQIVKYMAPIYNSIKNGDIEPMRCEQCDACKATKTITKVMTMEELNQREEI